MVRSAMPSIEGGKKEGSKSEEHLISFPPSAAPTPHRQRQEEEKDDGMTSDSSRRRRLGHFSHSAAKFQTAQIPSWKKKRPRWRNDDLSGIKGLA